MNFIALVIFGLATWRVASMLVQEDGPWKLFIKIREMSGIKHDHDGFAYMIPDKLFAGILSCVWCCSMWVAIGWLVFWLIFPEISLKLATVFSFSTLAILIDNYVN